MRKSLKVLLTVLPFIYMGAIWYMSSQPDDLILDLPSSSVDHFIKEALHLVEFAILYMLFAAALAAHGKLTSTWSILAAILASLYGICDEIHQSFIPARSASLIDVIKDVIGVLAAYFHVRYHYFKHHRGFLTIIENMTRKAVSSR
ncbi:MULTISPECIES: VanZ family protein [Bacillaceae]|uniref:VanZ family protein n=1 Tax=Peribacillus huizhouensis TaxID=1501239 RepID=A0ABR6CT06_9BACI|nr:MULTISPECIES: VanZ family protein [Bacillaceae]MBA9027861.1 VanZ family protein [Peribacillus huizhouensis]